MPRQNCFLLAFKFTPIAVDWELSLVTGVGRLSPRVTYPAVVRFANKLGSDADTLGMGSTADRSMLFGGSIRLHQEKPLDDLLNIRLFPWRDSAQRC
jgi:hypothetical protein